MNVLIELHLKGVGRARYQLYIYTTNIEKAAGVNKACLFVYVAPAVMLYFLPFALLYPFLIDRLIVLNKGSTPSYIIRHRNIATRAGTNYATKQAPATNSRAASQLQPTVPLPPAALSPFVLFVPSLSSATKRPRPLLQLSPCRPHLRHPKMMGCLRINLLRQQP